MDIKDVHYTLIFEDNNNLLYNFLTHGIISNYPGCIDSSKYPQLSTSHVTGTRMDIFDVRCTHMKIFNKKNIKSNETCFDFTNSNLICSDKKCFKLELILNNPLEYICDIKTPTNERNPQNHSEKEVVLYYKFNDNNNNKYIFFKLEKHTMNSISHLFDFFNQTRNDTYVNRRENEGANYNQNGGVNYSYESNINNESDVKYNYESNTNYNYESNTNYNHKSDIKYNHEGGFFGLFTTKSEPDIKHVTKYATKSNDLIFYNKLKFLIYDDILSDQLNIIIPKIEIDVNEILRKVKYYNDNIRTGSELFIMEELKNYLLKKYIDKDKLHYLIK
jgi:hypothetical protein